MIESYPYIFIQSEKHGWAWHTVKESQAFEKVKAWNFRLWKPSCMHEFNEKYYLKHTSPKYCGCINYECICLCSFLFAFYEALCFLMKKIKLYYYYNYNNYNYNSNYYRHEKKIFLQRTVLHYENLKKKLENKRGRLLFFTCNF